ncbi:MAG TPA: ABC transporter ATP-binding protein [Candidatus Polarisedimenticolaceae bacterium]|nr:ABC transporter ATP-binding protein [Candidatus Polarisedimenticolaceae bacterium]
MIELRGLSRTFRVGGRPVEALRELDLTIPGGDYLSIMGPSGSGKSTLLNLIGCLDRPTAGSYRLDGREVSGLDEAELTQVRRHKIGFVFQSFQLIPRMTAAGNVELPMTFAGVERAERRRRAGQVLTAVGLAPRSDHRPDQLSGGEQQRVAIARAIAMDPAIVLADEPTGNLDSRSGREIIELLERMNQDGRTLILVTHDPEIARRAAHRIRLTDGRLVEERRSTPAAGRADGG